MIQRVCTLLILILAVSGAYAAPAVAQGTPTCTLVAVAEPDPPPPSPTPVAAEHDGDTVDGQSGGTSSSSGSGLFAAPDCATSRPYPGPFTDLPMLPVNPYIAPDLAPGSGTAIDGGGSIDVPTQPASSTSVDTRDLAHSGSESFVLAYLGTGLLAFGAFAMAIRRGTHHD